MNKMQTPEEIAELKKAYENGAVIEYLPNDISCARRAETTALFWDVELFTYRIKPTVTNIKLKTPEIKHNHYFKDVSKLKKIDIYRIFKLYDVTDPCLQHAGKKILLPGERGEKDIYKDVREAIDSLERWCDMYIEDKQNE
jgi:hypothetical protein